MALFVKHDLGQLFTGVIVEVTPAHQANVYVMDARNFELYRRRRNARCMGGPARARVPVRFTIPTDDRWFVVVDLNGGRGKINASVRVLDPATIDADVTDTVGSAVSAQQLLGGR